MQELLEKSKVFQTLEMFTEMVELSSTLEILNTEIKEAGREVFVIADHSIAEGVKGCKIEVDVSEVINKVSDIEQAKRFVDVLMNLKPAQPLAGITRIVGYYSRVNNWNKSKIGELRDRNQRNYALGGATPKHDEDRHNMINNH